MTIAPTVEELERAILARRYWYGTPPVLSWNFANNQLWIDPAGNRSFHEGKSGDKIDGVVAKAMAVTRTATDASGVITSAEWFTEDMFWPEDRQRGQEGCTQGVCAAPPILVSG